MCPNPTDWCPYKKKKLRYRHAQRDDHVKTQGEDGHLQAKEEASGETNPADTLISNFQLPELCEYTFCC